MPIQIIKHSPQIELTKYRSGVIYEDFTGEYEYDPLTTTQIVACNNKHMLDDITFNMIQTRETALSTGGVMFEILG